MERRPRTPQIGWWLTGIGAAFLVGGAGILWAAYGDPWATAGLLIGMIGGAFVGTGGSLVMTPEDYPPRRLCLVCGEHECDGCRD